MLLGDKIYAEEVEDSEDILSLSLSMYISYDDEGRYSFMNMVSTISSSILTSNLELMSVESSDDLTRLHDSDVYVVKITIEGEPNEYLDMYMKLSQIIGQVKENLYLSKMSRLV